MDTSSPSLASRKAIARPIPEAAPVTTAIRPEDVEETPRRITAPENLCLNVCLAIASIFEVEEWEVGSVSIFFG